jgi:hypothetical protein
MNIVGIIFTGKNKYGDFNWMIKQNEFMDSLFIFNDDEQFAHTGITRAGNAVISKYIKNTPQMAVGIPTGKSPFIGGYNSLEEGKHYIDLAIVEIKKLLQSYKYKTIFWSMGVDGLLGTNIFKLPTNIKEYITIEIKNILL